MIYLDTHVVVWLYAGETERFPQASLHVLEKDALVISPIVLLELQSLLEIERITVSPTLILNTLEADIGLTLCRQNFARIVLESLNQMWTRDPFDRIIVAQAALAGMPLITKDVNIQKHYSAVLWD